MCTILLNLKPLRKLAIDGSDHLANCTEQMLRFLGQSLLLIAPRLYRQAYSVLFEQFCSLICADKAFVAEYLETSMLTQDLKTALQVRAAGWRQFKIQHRTAQVDQQMQFEIEDRLLPGRYLAKDGPKDLPNPNRAWVQIKLHHRNLQAIDNTLLVTSQIRGLQPHLADQIESWAKLRRHWLNRL